MKKFFWLGCAAVALLASCSQDETVETPSSKAISFGNTFVDNATRSVDPGYSSSNLPEDFNVYGYSEKSQIFAGDEVSYNSSDWTYTNLRYWEEGSTYAFGAIAPAGATTVTTSKITSGDATPSKVGMTVNFTNLDGKTDLLHAASNVINANATFMENPQKVEFTFKHQLSKVKFSFTNNVSGAYYLKVSDVKITDAKQSGTLTVDADANNAWSNQTGTLTLDFGAVGTTDASTADEIAYDATAETYNELLMIPTANTQSYTVTFTVGMYNETDDSEFGTYNHSVTISGVELKLGYCYDFAATLTAENIDPENPLQPIKFEVSTVDGWNEDEQNQTINVSSL